MQVSEEDFYTAIDYIKSKPKLSDRIMKVAGLKTPCHVSVMRSGKVMYYVADEIAYTLGLAAREIERTVVKKLERAEPQARKREAEKKFHKESLRQRRELAKLAELFEEDL